MSLAGNILKLPPETDEVSILVGDVLERHDEGLFIGVDASRKGKRRLKIYTKAHKDGILYPYLTSLLRELVRRHEQQCESAPVQASTTPG